MQSGKKIEKIFSIGTQTFNLGHVYQFVPLYRILIKLFERVTLNQLSFK